MKRKYLAEREGIGKGPLRQGSNSGRREHNYAIHRHTNHKAIGADKFEDSCIFSEY